MKKILILSVMSLLALSMTACKDKYEPKENESEQVKDDDVYVSEEDANWVRQTTPFKYPFRYFIMGYEFIDKIGFSIYSSKDVMGISDDLGDNVNGKPVGTIIEHDVNNLTLHVGRAEGKVVAGPYHVTLTGGGGGIQCTVKEEEVFNALAQKHNDANYNGYYNVGWVFAKGIDYLNITCDKDYDDHHKAGELLNDMIKVKYYSAKPFLESKYKNRRLEDHGYTRFNSSLTEFNDQDIVELICYSVELTFSQNPQTAGIYKFTITYCDEDGAVKSVTTYPIKLKAR